VPGFTVPVHRALTEHILLGGAPRALAILNGTLAGPSASACASGWSACHLGRRPFRGRVGGKRDPLFVEVGRRHLRIPAHLSV
jgi:type IV secretion system protein VirB3